jgi:hypothetical protein
MYRRERGYGNRLLSEKYAKANYDRHKKKIEDARMSDFGDVIIQRRTPMCDNHYATTFTH